MSQAKRLAAGVPIADANGKVTTIPVGDKAGELVKWYDFPTYSNLISLGHMDDTTDVKAYFEGLLRYMAATLGKSGGCFIGSMTPNTQGLGTLHMYTSGTSQDTGLPMHCSGLWYNLYGSIYTFGTTTGQFFCYRFQGTKL